MSCVYHVFFFRSQLQGLERWKRSRRKGKELRVDWCDVDVEFDLGRSGRDRARLTVQGRFHTLTEDSGTLAREAGRQAGKQARMFDRRSRDVEASKQLNFFLFLNIHRARETSHTHLTHNLQLSSNTHTTNKQPDSDPDPNPPNLQSFTLSSSSERQRDLFSASHTHRRITFSSKP